MFNRISSFIMKYGIFIGPYSVIKWVIHRYTQRAYADRIANMDSRSFKVKGISNFEKIYKGDIQQEIKRILNGERKLLFYQTDDVNIQKDIKTRWELNRMHHLPVLALAKENKDVYELFRKELQVERLNKIFEDTNAMEVSISVINIITACQLINDKMPLEEITIQQFLKNCFQYIIKNNENGLRYSGNHYFFNLLGLLWITSNIEGNAETERICTKTTKGLLGLLRQIINEDGSLYEGSTYYHRYVTDSLLCFLILNPGAKCYNKFFQYAEKMYYFCRYATSQDTLIGIGDNDSGRVLPLPQYFNYSSTDLSFTMRLAELLNMRYSEAFENNIKRLNLSHRKAFGLTKLEQGDWRIALRCDLFGDKMAKKAIGTHYHNDQLAIIAWYNNKNIFIDTGVYSYIQDNNIRLQNLQTASHNTVVVNGQEQNIIHNNWQYTERGAVGRLISYDATSFEWEHNGYKDIVHRRKILIQGALTIQDSIICSKHMEAMQIKIYFHLHPDIKLRLTGSSVILEDVGVVLCLKNNPKCKIEIEPSRYSPEYGKYITTKAIVISMNMSGETKKMRVETEIQNIV